MRIYLNAGNDIETPEQMRDPFPSVPRDHAWSMLIRAVVVDDFGIAPYWFQRITSRTAGLTTSSTTNSSATLETQGVSEIGLKSFFRSSTGFFLRRGGTSAIFQWCCLCVSRAVESPPRHYDRITQVARKVVREE